MTHPLFAIVVDDDPSVCRALGRLLRSAGIDVETRPSGESFLGTALPREPDCLVLDVRMPGMTGPQLRQRLLAAGRRIPVVFITANAVDEDALTGGEEEILRKPFGGQALVDAIERAAARGDGPSPERETKGP
jgi:FixJ family two-component response regulator